MDSGAATGPLVVGNNRQGPLVVIVGQTASGKSALAMDLARRFDGEIICADSRTIYKGMDIGTAKPTQAEREKVTHHLLDVITPDQSFSAAQFKEQANQAIADICRRGKLPILVGGTGLYVDAVLFDFQFSPLPDTSERGRLKDLSVEELQAEVIAKGLPLPFNDKNPRHLMRLLETGGVNRERSSLRSHTLVLGLEVPRDILFGRITARTEAMLEQGFIDEVKTLADQYGWDAPGLLAPGYKAFRGFLKGAKTKAEAKDEFIRNDMSLAKKQLTWFKRHNSIQWIHYPSDAVDIVTTFLSK